MALTTTGVFLWRRPSNPTEPRLISISAAAWISVGSFAALAFSPFVLMLPVFAAAISLTMLEFTDAGVWVHSHFTLLTVLMLPLMSVFVPIAYLYGRRRAPKSESTASALLRAGIRVVAIVFFGSMGVFVLFLVGGVLKANGLLG